MPGLPPQTPIREVCSQLTLGSPLHRVQSGKRVPSSHPGLPFLHTSLQLGKCAPSSHPDSLLQTPVREVCSQLTPRLPHTPPYTPIVSSQDSVSPSHTRPSTTPQTLIPQNSNQGSVLGPHTPESPPHYSLQSGNCASSSHLDSLPHHRVQSGKCAGTQTPQNSSTTEL